MNISAYSCFYPPPPLHARRGEGALRTANSSIKVVNNTCIQHTLARGLSLANIGFKWTGLTADSTTRSSWVDLILSLAASTGRQSDQCHVRCGLKVEVLATVTYQMTGMHTHERLGYTSR